MLLTKRFFKKHLLISIDEKLSKEFEHKLLRACNGTEIKIVIPISRVLVIDGGGIIECLSIPSPGSPYRKLSDFGNRYKSAEPFLNDYLEFAFKWFNN